MVAAWVSPGCGKKDGAVLPNFAAAPTPTPTPCDPGTGGWTFDASLEGWGVGWTQSSGCGQAPPSFCFPVTVTFDAADGNAAPGSGAVSLAFTDSSSAAQVRLNPPAVDLTGKPVCARVRLDAGSARAKLFVKSGASYIWANGPEAVLTAGSWTTLTLDPDNPSYAGSGFDPSDIREVGVEFAAGGTVEVTQVHFDHWVY